MTTQQDLAEATEGLATPWQDPTQRRNTFGNALRSMSIHGIRGLDVEVDFNWPVVAIAGTNGSGKTTLLQIASAAYTTVASGARHYTLGRWIGPAMERLDESPNITPDARITYQFYDETPTVEVAYQPHRTRWGYPRRGNPSRFVQFIGIGNYAPRIEKIDRTHLARGRLEVRGRREILPRVLESFSRILGRTYDSAVIATVSVPAAQWTDDVPILRRENLGYAWPNMGAGEQKLLRLIEVLEALPSRSLLLLEEPELTLHGDAQQGFAWYLMTLARRNGHQIIVATHSQHIFEALPPEGRILITRVRGDATILHRAPRFSAARRMAAGARPSTELIFVEDQVAERFLLELTRRFVPEFRHSAQIVPLGSSDDVRRAVLSMRRKGIRAVGIRDPDIGAAEVDGLFSLPGTIAIEHMLLSQENIVRSSSLIGDLQPCWERAQASGLGHVGSGRAKRVYRALVRELALDSEFVSDRLTLGWLLEEENATVARALLQRVREFLDRE